MTSTDSTDALEYNTRYGYDPSGNLTETVWPNGNENYYEYFKDNLLKRVSYNNDSRTYDFTYNPTHTLKDVTDKQFSKPFIYGIMYMYVYTTFPFGGVMNDKKASLH